MIEVCARYDLLLTGPPKSGKSAYRHYFSPDTEYIQTNTSIVNYFYPGEKVKCHEFHLHEPDNNASQWRWSIDIDAVLVFFTTPRETEEYLHAILSQRTPLRGVPILLILSFSDTDRFTSHEIQGAIDLRTKYNLDGLFGISAVSGDNCHLPLQRIVEQGKIPEDYSGSDSEDVEVYKFDLPAGKKGREVVTNESQVVPKEIQSVENEAKRPLAIESALPLPKKQCLYLLDNYGC